jgi:hypothetical protein
MAFDDAFGSSGKDLLQQSLLEQYQPDDGQPFSVEPKVLTDRLARKLAIRPTRDADVDFNVAPEQPKAPDLAKFGTPVKDEVAPEPSTDDLSKFGTKVAPEGPEQPPLTIMRQGAAALKGIPHGAIESTGGVMKGAARLHNDAQPYLQSLEYDESGNIVGQKPMQPAAPIEQHPLYKAGQATQDFAQTVAPMTAQEKESIAGRVGTGIGSIAPYAAATLAGGPLVGLTAAAAGMATDTYGSVFEAAKAAGKTDDEANASAGKAALAAGVLGSLPLGAGKYAKGLIAKMAASSAAFATLGEAQEAILQEIAKDYDPKAGYTFDQKRLIAELILGAGMGGLHHAFERGQPQQQQPQQPPGAQPGAAGGALPGGGPQPSGGAGPQPGPGAQARGGAGPGPQPGAGPQPGPGAGPNPGAGGPGQQQTGGAHSTNTGTGPGKPPPGTGTGKAGEAGYTMDPATRAKMERVYRHFEQGKDPSGMTDGELFDAVNEHLRDTSSTGHTAKPETPEEAAAREQAATDRDQREVLKKAGWTDAHVNAMTPEQRQKYYDAATAKAQPRAQEKPVGENQTAPKNEQSDIPKGTRDEPIKAATADDILNAAPVEPKSQAQADAENFKHAHVEIDHLGLVGKHSISIETGVGQERKGTGPDGKEWSVTMPVAYGRIKGTKGGDGQPLDIFVGPQPTSQHVFVVDQHHAGGGDFDEHKILVGFPGPDAALRAYSDSYTDQGGDRIGHVVAMTPNEFQAWLKSDTSVALKKDIQQPSAGRNVDNPTQEKAAVPGSHHTPGTALPNPESHHSPERAGEETNEQRGAAPTADSPSPPITKPSDSAAVKRGTTGTDGVNGRPSATKKAPKSAVEPQNLLQFIAAKGGLKPHPELMVMDAHKHLVTMSGFQPRRKLVKDDGMDLDRAREAAEEAGYFRGSHEGTSTIAEFLDAIDDGIRGKHRYPEGEEGHRTQRELTADEERAAYEETRAKELVDQLNAAGHGELGPEIKDRVLRIMSIEGADPDTAVDKALAALDVEEQIATPDQIDDIYGHGAYDEIVHGEVPYEGGGIGPRGGEGSHGDQETAPTEPRARAPDQGEDAGPEDEGNDAGRAESADGEPDTEGAAGDQAARRRAENPADAERSDGDVTADIGGEEYDPEKDENAPLGAWADMADVYELADKLTKGKYPTHELTALPVEKIFPKPAKTVRAAESAKETLTPEQAQARIQSWKDHAARIGKEEDHSKEVIFSLFDRTGEWSKPYRDAGYKVVQYDIHNGDDLLKFFPTPDILAVEDAGLKVVGVITAPPCTSYAVSGARWWADQHDKANVEMVEKKYGGWAPVYFDTPLDYANTLVAATQAFVEFAKPSQFHVLENPVGRIQKMNGLPKPTLIFDPNQYGNPYTKKTLLWGDFNPDLPTANVEPTEGSKIHKLFGNDPEQKLQRSETPDGFAYAFFVANNTSKLKYGEATDRKAPEPKEPTVAERKAERDAPTWAEILHELPKVTTGKFTNPDTDLAFKIMSDMNGLPAKKQKYNNLTPAQKHELLAKLKAEKPAPFATKPASPYEITSPDQIDRSKPVVLGTVYRGTESGNRDARLRTTDNGDLGRGVYVTHLEKLAASYGGGPKARVSDGTRVVHTFNPSPVAPKDAAFAFGNSQNSTVKVVRATGETIWEGKWASGRVNESDSPMGAAIRESGVKVVIGATGGFLHNQTAVLDKSILEPTTEAGADNKPQMVLPGAEKASDGTMAKRAAAAPLKPKVAQKAADDGLFGDGHKQTDLLDMAAAPPKQPKAPAPPKDAFDDIFDQAIDAEFAPKVSLDIDDVAKGLGKLFGKGLSETEPPFVDEDKYKQALPFFKAGVEHFGGGGADLATMVRSLVRHLSVAGMDADAIRAMKPYIRRFTDDVTAGRETINAPSRSDVLESDRGNAAPANSVGKADVPAAAGPAGQGAGQRGSAPDAGDQRSAGSERVSQDHAPVVGASGHLELPHREPVDEGSDAGDRNDQRSGADREGGFSFDDGTTDEAVRNAQKDADLNARRQRQQQADRQNIPFKWGRIDNIAASLPMLFPEQHYDVQTAENRFIKTEGHGMLFTNGTGTGKTYSGGGVIKRFFQQGKRNVLVVAPSQGILMDWQRSMRDLGLDMTILDSTVDAGKGLTGTTYANLGANRVLADREWDLVVADEAHKLSSDQNGTVTSALKTFRALTKHPDGLYERALMVLRKDWEKVERAPKDLQSSEMAKFNAKATPLIDKWRDEQRPKALMMSATPFAYHFSLDYAEGYLFEFDREDNGSRYNSGGGREKFYMQHLGYRMRTNKLTKPDADVKSEVMERQLHEYLKKQGSLSGRALTVDKDYDRKFVLAHDAVGEQIDRALNFLQEAEDGRYRPLYDAISKQFDYLTRMRLLEAIKARAAVPFIQENLDLGRKVVVFHDYNEGGGINPFDLAIPPNTKTATYQNGKHVEISVNDMYDDFRRQNPYIADLKFASYLPPIAELTKSFPDAMVYNGTVSNKIRNEAKRLFNDDDSGRDIIIVQSAAGEAGISLHDTTGKRQRVLLNLGMPIRPTSSIQQEGRIYRVGQASDAIFRYMNTGTDWERWTFAGKIADRAGTAENLALGDQARTIRQSFIDAFSNAGDYAPERGEGKGGKEADRAISHSVSEFDKAKTHYFANAKTSGRRDQREGVDYYATPEPVGLKMVEFAGVKSGEKMLEPSAGHGAIARYFPEDTARTLVEPSSSLASRAALNTPGARVVVDRFENLDKGANKFDAIVMNPPFGHGGATAIEHLRKAMGHLKNGGRIVALIPRGSTDEKFNKLMDSVASKDIYLVGDIKLPSVTFERAGTSISARIVVLEKQTDQEVRAKLQSKSRDYSDVTKIGELFDRIENAALPDRLEPRTKDVDIPTEGKVTVGGVDFYLQSSKRGDIHSAELKSFMGASKFRDVMNAATETGGDYVKSAKRIDFNTEAARQAFLDRVANPPAEPEAPKAPSGVTFKTGETIHAKTRAKLFVATANERVAGDVYSQMNAVAKANGGYYSSFKGNGAIPGFQFKSAEERAKFLDQMGGALGEPEAPFQAGAIGQQDVLNHGRSTGNERYVAYDQHGEIVSQANGDTRTVDFTPELKAMIFDPRSDVVIHHNHPSGRSLSRADIVALAYPGLRAIWATGHNANVYRAELTPEFKALGYDPLVTNDRLKILYGAADNAIYMNVRQATVDGHLTVDEANDVYGHLVNLVLRDAGVLDYQTNYDPRDLIARAPDLSRILTIATNMLRRRAFGDKATSIERNDRRAGPLRHAGDLGAVFDRASLAKPVGGAERLDRARGADHRAEAPGEPDKNGQLRLLDQNGLEQPDNAFVKPGSHDVAIADVLRTRLLGKLGQLNATEARTQLQDKFARVKNAEESVGAPSSQSAHQAESLYYGRTGQRLESLNEHHIDPLIREMKARDIDLDKLDEFLYARHAPERNQKIGRMYADQPAHDFYRAVHDPDVVGASGMSTNDALGVIRALRAAGKLQDYLAVARMVDALNARTRRALFDAGLIDRDTFDAWNSGYKYYVPLRGHAEGDQFMAGGSGMNVRGKEAKTAFGRRSKADSPVAYTIMQAEMAIVRAEKNKVGNTFLQFVRANPDPARWTVDRPPQVKRIDPMTGLVTSIPDNLYANRDNVFTTKLNGRDVYISLHGPDGLNLARALKNMGTANVHRLIRAYSAVTHAMSKLATSWNPEFMIPNFARDLGEAFINLQAQEQRGFVKNFIKHIPGAMRGSMAAIAGRTPPPGSALARYVDAFNRFDKAGGRVRFFGIDDPDAIETNVNRRLSRLEGGPVNTLKDIGDKAAKGLEIAGGGIENATRLAAFMAAEDAGIGTADAAMLARNLTVDFNKKGELGSAVSALYMFANAGIQGQARMVRALGYRRVWQAVGALAAAAALSTLFSILASDTDETGIPDYMKIPPWERDKNLIFTIGGHRYLKVPLPYGFAPFAVIGSHAVSVTMGHEKPGKAAAAVMDSIISAFNPLGEESTAWMDIVPSAIRPAFHIQFNKNWTGKPLYPDQDKNRGNRPESTQAFKSNSAFSKEAAKQLNAWSGGTPYQPGAIDVHPASIDHTLQAVTGGVGHFVKGIVDSMYQNLSGGEWQPEKAPIMRRFVGKVGPEADAALYYEKRQETLDEKAGVNAARKDLKGGTNTAEAKQFLDETPSSKASIFKSADDRIKALRTQKNLTETELRDRIRQVQNQARAQVKQLQPSQ